MNLRRARILSLIALGAIIACLLCDDDLVRYSAAALVVAGAVPWWRAMHNHFQRRFWCDVESLIVASHEQSTEGVPSEQG